MNNKWVFLVIGIVLGGGACACLLIALLLLGLVSAAPGAMSMAM